MTNKAKGQQREITLKLGLQSTEAYFPYIAYVIFFNIIIKEAFFQLKIHAANIEASESVCFLSVMENYILKDFSNASKM